MHDDGREFDAQAMVPVRSWLKNLTHRRQRIVTFNGKRGASSRYSITPGIQLETVLKDETAPETVETELSHIEPATLYILAQRLKSLNEVLEALGRPVISEEMMERLKPYRPDLKHLRDRPDVLKRHREESLHSMVAVFEDDQKFEELIDSFDPASPGAEFIELVYGQLQTSEDRSFMRMLICADLRHASVQSRGDLESLNLVLVSEAGEIIWSRDPQPEQPAADEDAAAEPAQEEHVVPEEPQVTDTPEEADVAAASEVEAAAQSEPEERRSSLARREQLDRIKQEAEGLVEKFLQNFRQDQTYTRNQISTVFHTLTQKEVDDAVKNIRVVKLRSDVPGVRRRYDVSEVIHLCLYSNSGLRHIYQQRSNGKHIKRIVNAVVEEALSAAPNTHQH
jgi:hypothetical protein